MPKSTRHKENKISTNDMKVPIPKLHHNQLIDLDLGTNMYNLGTASEPVYLVDYDQI